MSDFGISACYGQLPGAAFPAGMMEQTVQLYQHDAFFHLALAKNRRRKHLQEVFADVRPEKVWISNNLRHLAPRGTGLPCDYLERGYFSPERAATASGQLARSIVIVNNNDLHQGGDPAGFVAVFNACPETIFIVWDWDNHHWLGLSVPLAVHSDLYAPTHHENHFLLSRYAVNITDSVAAGVAQWTAPFLEQHRSELVSAERSNQPLGRHIPYGPFQYRNRVVATLSPHFASVGFSSHQFHEMTELQKMQEWAAHKSHWIVPVLNDIPIRVFDALATGGIPLIPDTLRFTHWLADAHRDDVLYYAADDIVQPAALVQRACELFDRHGERGIIRRHEYAMDRHHGDVRLASMLDAAASLYGFLWRV